MIRSVVAAPFIPIASLPNSHRGAQGIIYGDMIFSRGDEEIVIDIGAKLVEDFNDFDRLYVYHGNDWGGSLNLYGGLEAFPYAKNTKKIFDFRGEVISLGIDFPEYHRYLSHKMKLTLDRDIEPLPEFKQLDFDNLLSIQKRAVTVSHPYLTSRVTVGDSHGISLYRPGWTVNSVSYKTLHGALKHGLLNFVLEPYSDPNLVEEVELYFGNIDVRHHLCRHPDRVSAVKTLVEEYFKQAEALYDSLPRLNRVVIRELLPIEDESRVIPKTGWYNGQGFYGSWQERNEMRLLFAEECEKRASARVHFKKWVSYLINSVGQLDFAHMEYKRSVHLSRSSYPEWRGEKWDLALLSKKVTKAKCSDNSLERYL